MYHFHKVVCPFMRASLPPAPRPDRHVARWIARELAAAPPRASSLTITIWGDAIAPHGGAVMLPGLIRLLEPFGVNARLTRTSVFRLARERWLGAKRIGRRSLYCDRELHPRSVRAADRRAARRRQALRDELHWEGFGVLAPGVHARPVQADDAPLPATATALPGLIVVRARDAGPAHRESLAASVPRAWDLARIALDYRKFLRRFGAVIERFRRASPDDHDPEQCFVVRTLLIHEYRRVLLRDPRLPVALLPLDWPGAAAYALCRDFYRLTHGCAERHLTAVLEGPRGKLPPANAAFYARFGGLTG